MMRWSLRISYHTKISANSETPGMATPSYPTSLSQFPPDLVQAVAEDAAADADRVGQFLDALGLRPTGDGAAPAPLRLPSSFLIGLGAAMRLLAWEQRGLTGWTRLGANFGAISTHMRDLLTRKGIPAGQIIDVPGGLTAADRVPLTEAPPLPAAAESGFLLSMGRAQPYKGFEDLLDALHLLHATGVRLPHLLLAAVTDGPATSHQHHLRHRADALGLPLQKFAPDAVHTHPFELFRNRREQTDNSHFAILQERMQRHGAVFTAAPAKENRLLCADHVFPPNR